MCVQDLIQPHINIAAKMTKQEVYNFVQMCQIFAKQLPNCNDEYSMTTPNPTRTTLSIQSLTQSTDFFDLIKKQISSTRVPAVLEIRERFEQKITSTLVAYVRKFDSTLKSFPFGSTQYGVKIANANFNLLISTSESYIYEAVLNFSKRILYDCFFHCFRW